MAKSLYDQDNNDLSKNNIQLCSTDQQKSGSCRSPTCTDLHMCYEYLLNKKCEKFESSGKCSHSHSLFTRHNQNILGKKLRLSAEDEQAFDTVAECIRKSKSSEKKSGRFDRFSITDDDRKTELTSRMTSAGRGRGGTLFPAPASDPHGKITSISTRLFSEHPSLSQTMVPKSTDSSWKPRPLMATHSIDLSNNQFGQDMDNKRMLSTRHSIAVFEPEQEKKFSTYDHASLSDDSGFLGTNPSISDRTQMKYIFKHYKNVQLPYLFGPVRRQLVENEQYQIFPSGYCRLIDTTQEYKIEQKLGMLLPTRLNMEWVQITNDDLAIFLSTSAAERLFEQNQLDYAIISELHTTRISIEVINTSRVDRTRSSSVPSGRLSSARLPAESEKSRSASDGKFHIQSTNSSIDVIRGDITQIPVDLMVCVSTSITLLKSVLSRAGSSIKSEFNKLSQSENKILLDGGFTSARKILFITWQLEVRSSDTMKAQKSLSDLVKWCIDEANRLHLKSISFPSIGTGTIGLDANKVCEAMFQAASERLHQYKMDVLFVIYPSSGADQHREPYNIFRSYLDGLCKEKRPSRAEASSIAYSPLSLSIPVEISKQIQRNVECKHIATVSNSSNMAKYHQLLIQSLEKLIKPRTFDLSLVRQLFIDQVDSLIDVCLGYHVIPCINFVKRELTLRGDDDSCSQCFANLHKQRPIQKYSISPGTGKKSDETKFNMYISMKIDEALATGDSNTRIEDDNKTVYDIDLNNLQVRINEDPRSTRLICKPLNESKRSPPKSWSSSPLMIRTVEIPRSSFRDLDCVYTFEQTMPPSEWQIERIDSIENYPLYVHYARKKDAHEILTFHGCSFSSVQSIIHYGLHSNYDQQSKDSILLTRDALNSHICSGRRSTDGKYYLFAVELSKKNSKKEFIHLSNEEAYLALPTYLIVYKRRRDFE